MRLRTTKPRLSRKKRRDIWTKALKVSNTYIHHNQRQKNKANPFAFSGVYSKCGFADFLQVVYY